MSNIIAIRLHIFKNPLYYNIFIRSPELMAIFIYVMFIRLYRQSAFVSVSVSPVDHTCVDARNYARRVLLHAVRRLA